MRLKLAFASLLVLSGCGASREALLALQDMRILENNDNASISYKKLSGSGGDLTLSDVDLRTSASTLAMMGGPSPEGEGVLGRFKPDAKPVTIAHAGTMTLKGLTMKDGKPFASDIVLNQLSPIFPTPGATISLGSIGFEGMNEATGLFIAGAFTEKGPGETPALERWAFKRAGLGDLKLAITVPKEDSDPGVINVELADLSASNLDNTRLGALRLAGLKGDVNLSGVPPVAGTFDFGKMEFSSIRTKFLADSFMAGFQSALDPSAPVDYAAMYAGLTSPLDGGIDRFDWTGAAVNVSGLKFDVSEMHTAATRNADDIVVAARTPKATLKFTADSGAGTLGAMGHMVMAMAGYDSNVIEMYVAGDATFDPARDFTHWNGLNIGVTDAFDITVSGGVIGLRQALPNIMAGLGALEALNNKDETEVEIFDDEDADEGEDEDDGADADEGEDDAADADEDADADEGEDSNEGEDSEDEDDDFAMTPDNSAAVMALVMGFLPLQLTDLDISITDQKILNLILERQSMDAGQSVEDLRKDLVNMVTGSATFLTDAGVDPAISSELTAAISGFLSGPGAFHITLKPKTPLGVMSAMMTPMTKENLGFSATFTPAAAEAPKVN